MEAIRELARITVDEFWQIATAPENAEKHLELIDGEIIEMPASSTKNTVIAARISGYMMVFVETHDLGYISGADGGFQLDPFNAPQPDTAFIRKERVPDLETNTFQGAPDLAVEVVSPSETRHMIDRKTRRYLEHGSKRVWLVYPESQTVEVCRLNEDGTLNRRLLSQQDTLTGEDVLLNFELPLSKIFK